MSTPVDSVLAQGRGGPLRLPLPPMVTSPKSSSAYGLHSYPTKIPPEAIMPFIEASTTPGAVVLDPFCGSGMTGIAAQQCGRSAVLSDLSPGAVHLALNHNLPASSDAILGALAKMESDWMRRTESDLYATVCPTCSGPGLARHTIWSDVHACTFCGSEVVVWDEADPENGSVPRNLVCVKCQSEIKRGGSVPLRIEPVVAVIACQGGCSGLQEDTTSVDEVAYLDRLSRRRLQHWFPDTVIETTREMYKRSALHLRGVKSVRDLYLPRARHALSILWHEIGLTLPTDVRESLRFAFTNTSWHASRMRRYNARGGQRPLTGTLYIPQLTAEANVFEVFRHQVRQIAGFSANFKPSSDSRLSVQQSDAGALGWLRDGSIDYVFTDPPFGSNIFYADCNIVWESWLGKVTDPAPEIVVNKSRTAADGGKDIDAYEDLLTKAFSEIKRVLHPQGRASIVFHNSDDRVWTALLSAAERADLQQTDVSILDKVQRSMKGYKGRAGRELVPFYDLVISFAPGRVNQPHLNGAGEIAIEAVADHLGRVSGMPAGARERSLEFLYSLAVSEVVTRGAQPEGLSYRAFQALCSQHFDRQGQHFSIR